MRLLYSCILRGLYAEQYPIKDETPFPEKNLTKELLCKVRTSPCRMSVPSQAGSGNQVTVEEGAASVH